MKVNLEITKKEPVQFSCVEEEYPSDWAAQDIPGKVNLTSVRKSRWNCFLSCLAYHSLKKTGKLVDELEDVSQHEAKYKEFILNLDYTGTNVNHPYNKPVTIKQMKKILKKNKKVLNNLQVNIFGWLQTKTYAFELGMGAKKSKSVSTLRF